MQLAVGRSVFVADQNRGNDELIYKGIVGRMQLAVGRRLRVSMCWLIND
jgi:hypothetical protein